MPKNQALRKILVIGSGPIVIGQAAEFDYSGTQACQALREEGYETILINSNPATIMTDKSVADKVYLEPITLDFVARVIRKERPDGLLATLGGQTGLNMAVELENAGLLVEYGVKLLGTGIDAIQRAEDREQFRNLMVELGQSVPPSKIVRSLEEAHQFVERIGYPVIIRPAYTLGGTGGGFATNDKELRDVVASGLKASPIKQCLLEKSIAGYKEIEYEVMRDSHDNAIVVCNMENIDPVGIHTGDSVVVAPSQTLADREYQMLRDASLKIIRALQIEGGCNIQFALDPHSLRYYVIEVNPRVSRSSALASKATGYPIAKIAAKIAVGYSLDEIRNPITGTTYAGFEPALDYVVCKIPHWPFGKFNAANRDLTTQMKATGEVMAIGRCFEEALLKAVRSLEDNIYHLELPGLAQWSDSQLEEALRRPNDRRLFALAEAIRRDWAPNEICAASQIDRFFVDKIAGIIRLERELGDNRGSADYLWQAKRFGFTDKMIGRLWDCSPEQIAELRRQNGFIPTYKMVDTCAAEFASETPYYYSTYEEENESVVTEKPSVVVIGSGPIRIGQGLEFDYATVHAVLAIKEAGYEAIIINNNPETVSTDFSISDKLYFEPLYLEDVLNVIALEQPLGVILQFGGQTAINLAAGLAARGVPLLGTSLESIDQAEDRDKFEQLLHRLDIRRPPGRIAYSVGEALQAAAEIGYPVLVRPSYVLGGRAMEIVYSEHDLAGYIQEAVQVNPQHPVLIDRYLQGKEFEVDAVADGEEVFIPGVLEHIERAGVHSGDSIAVYPPQNLARQAEEKIIEYTKALGQGLGIVGLLNIQFVVAQGEVYVLEVNPRASRTVPFLSKATGISLANLATKVILGRKLKDLGLSTGYHPAPDMVSVKVPVFSFAKLRSVDITLGPEMKSTGEVMGTDKTLAKALYKGLVASGMSIPDHGRVLFTIADKDKDEAVELVKRFAALGFEILATSGTARRIERAGISVREVPKIGGAHPDLLDIIREGKTQFVINTLTRGKRPARDGFRIRRESVENGVVCFTSLDTAEALLTVLESLNFSLQNL